MKIMLRCECCGDLYCATLYRYKDGDKWVCAHCYIGQFYNMPQTKHYGV